jgi:phenylpyruvate tautomerase PptA (4-oxalocrotonate tautomerase family)
MPHITIRMLKGLTPDQKRKLGEDASDAVNRNIPQPTGMSMGILEHELVEISPEDFARGGKLNTSPSAYVVVNFIEGRTPEEKIRVAKDMTKAVAKNLKISPEAVTVELIEFSPENISHGGKLTLDNPPPGIKLPGVSSRGTERKR